MICRQRGSTRGRVPANPEFSLSLASHSSVTSLSPPSRRTQFGPAKVQYAGTPRLACSLKPPARPHVAMWIGASART